MKFLKILLRLCYNNFNNIVLNCLWLIAILLLWLTYTIKFNKNQEQVLNIINQYSQQVNINKELNRENKLLKQYCIIIPLYNKIKNINNGDNI